MQLQQCQQQQGRRRTISNCLPNNFQLYSSSSATMMDDGLINKGEENSSSNSSNDNGGENMSRLGSTLTKIGLLTYIASMCAFLPVFLLPILALHRLGIIKSRVTKEHLSLRLGQFCSRWLMRLIPFAKVRCTSTVTLSAKSTSSSSSSKKDETEQSSVETKPEPCIWVCNHTSMLDIFVLLAYDLQMRGTKRRPIKIVYWKDLEKNIITKLLFTSCGFIPVEMSDNGQGNANVYKKSSFKNLLKSIKEAFVDGFDIGILPEGQLNLTPELGLQPIFPGAFTMARMSKRPIHMIAMHGINQLWNPNDLGEVTGRNIHIRTYPPIGGRFSSADEFVESFKRIVGHFGQYGTDLENYVEWLNGNAWTAKMEAEELAKWADEDDDNSHGGVSNEGDSSDGNDNDGDDNDIDRTNDKAL